MIGVVGAYKHFLILGLGFWVATGLPEPPAYLKRGLTALTLPPTTTSIPSNYHNELLFERDDNLKSVQPQACPLAGFGNADPPEECCVNLSGRDWHLCSGDWPSITNCYNINSDIDCCSDGSVCSPGLHCCGDTCCTKPGQWTVCKHGDVCQDGLACDPATGHCVIGQQASGARAGSATSTTSDIFSWETGSHQSPSKSSSFSTGGLVGTIIGVVVFLVILVTVCVCCGWCAAVCKDDDRATSRPAPEPEFLGYEVNAVYGVTR